VALSLGIKYNINTHSLRKTFARIRYEHSDDKTRTLVELMKIFNHANTNVTLNYICVSEEELEKLYNDVNLGVPSFLSLTSLPFISILLDPKSIKLSLKTFSFLIGTTDIS